MQEYSMNPIVKFFYIFLLLIIPTFLFGQIPDIEVILFGFRNQARIFYIGDLDPTGLGNAPLYYTLQINNKGSIDARIQLRLDILSGGESFVDATTEPFSLPAQQQYDFTNIQLSTGAIITPIPGTTEEVKFTQINLNFDKINNLQNVVSSTGKLPAGIYRFVFTVYQENNPSLIFGSTEETLTITNPTTIEPLYPGERVNQQVLTEIPTTFPYFYWQSDAQLFNLYVFRKYESKSVQDVLNRDPILHLERYPNNLFQYPAESDPLFFYNELGDQVGRSIGPVRPLEPGNTYYWYVEAIIPTNSGETILPSDIYQFKVSEVVGAQADADIILRYLRQILGDKYDNYMSQLQGCDPNGNILLNGVPVQIETLIQLATKIQDKQAEIKDIVVQ
jgi:hypothetical protein